MMVRLSGMPTLGEVPAMSLNLDSLRQVARSLAGVPDPTEDSMLECHLPMLATLPMFATSKQSTSVMSTMLCMMTVLMSMNWKELRME